MNEVLSYLKRNERRFVERLCSYVRFPSVSAQQEHRGDMERCARWLSGHCRSIGLETRVHRTGGHPIVVARTSRRRDSRRPHYLVYGHYDVQPPDPLKLWISPPFEPAIRRGRLYGRGASDNKGQHLAHLNAIEACYRTGAELPCDLTFVIEGEEEIGSPGLKQFLLSHRSELRCEGVVVSDTSMPSLEHPALTYGLRGNLGIEVTLRGPARELHSGIYGGPIENPAMVLCRLLASLRSPDGRIAVSGFYDDVLPLSRVERRRLGRLALTDRELRKEVGVPRLGGEPGYTSSELRVVRPTLEINGLTSGYQGEGGKTIIPAWATAKLTSRLVPDQEPAKVCRLIVHHLRQFCPPTVQLDVQIINRGSRPYLLAPDHPAAQAALRALRASFHREPVLVREGGSIPIVSLFRSVLGVETLLLGLGLPRDCIHSPNESFSLAAYRMGGVLACYLWPELAQLPRRTLGRGGRARRRDLSVLVRRKR